MDKALKLSLLIAAATLTTHTSYAQNHDVVHIKKRNSQNFALDGNSSAANGQSVYLWEQNQNNVNQQWIEINRGDGYYSYQKQGTNHCLDGGNGGADRQDVYLWECSDNNQNQHWQKITTDSGFYQLRKRNASGFALNGGSNGANGQNITLFDSSLSSQNLQWSIDIIGESSNVIVDNCTQVDSLADLKNFLTLSNQCVQMIPGTYTFDPNNTGWNQLFDDPTILKFTGNNNEFHFDNVTFIYDTNIFQQFDRNEVVEIQVTGNGNEFYNLTMEDLGNTVPFDTALALSLDGKDNLVEGFDITVRGSYPYGYGDIFGKGSERLLNHKKHAGILIRGESITLKDTQLLMRAYGHGIFMQGALDTVIDGCNVEGELSTVSAVLAEEGTGSDADNLDFETIWGFNLKDLTSDYRFSLQEDGIRAYTNGVPDGLEERDTGSITVLDTTVKFMRSGVGVGLARAGTHYVENVTVLGNESGFWLGNDGLIVNSRGDTSVGPLISEDLIRSNTSGDVTILDHEVSKIGNTPAFHIAGTGHNYTIKDGTSSVLSGITIQVGGARYGHRWNGNELDFAANNINIENETPYQMTLQDNSSNTTGSSCGPIRTDDGTNNNISRECN